MTLFGFVRHGSTDWNKDARIQGQMDVPLNEEGRSQARIVGERLALERWDAIVSSDLSRALETAQMIARSVGLPVRLEQRLRERGYGPYEGKAATEYPREWSGNWSRVEEPGIEPGQAVLDRCLLALDELAGEFPQSRVLVVTHSDVLCSLFNHVQQEERFDLLPNTSVSYIARDRGQWRIELLNCCKHLSV